MNNLPQINRRSFVIGTAAVGGGLALGLELPFGRARAATGRPEVNAWVVVRPDETVFDLFCGVGPFALTIARQGRARPTDRVRSKPDDDRAYDRPAAILRISAGVCSPPSGVPGTSA